MIDINTANKATLRRMARDAGIDVEGMNAEGMRAVLLAAPAPVEQPAVEELDESPLPTELAPEPATETVIEVPVPTPTIDSIVDQPVIEEPVLPPVLPVNVPVPVSKPARLEANGVKQPAVGTICRQIWDYCDTVYHAGHQPKAKELRAWGAGRLDDTTMTIQFYRWRKFRDISGKQT